MIAIFALWFMWFLFLMIAIVIIGVVALFWFVVDFIFTPILKRLLR